MRDSADEIAKFDVAYFMASVDDIETNTKFAAEHHAGFPILADANKSVSNAYGVIHPMGFANRWTFYIDKTGKVVKIDKDVNVRSAGEDMAETMAELDFPRK